MLPQITTFSGIEHHAYELNGDNRAVILVHGFPGTPDEMRPIAQLFYGLGWTAHAVLLPGFGPEINNLTEKSYQDWLNAVINAFDELKNRGYGPIVIAGNSMGGALAIHASVITKADGLILFSPFYRVTHILWKLLPVLSVIFPTIRPFRFIKADFSDPEMRQGILNFMPNLDLDDPETQKAVKEFRIPVTVFNHIRTAGQNAYHFASRVTCPVLCFQGKQDELVTPDNTKRLIERFTSDIRYIEIDAEHNLIQRDLPSFPKIEEAIKEFIPIYHRVKNDNT